MGDSIICARFERPTCATRTIKPPEPWAVKIHDFYDHRNINIDYMKDGSIKPHILAKSMDFDTKSAAKVAEVI